MIKKIILIFVLFLSFFGAVIDVSAEKDDFSNEKTNIELTELKKGNNKVVRENEHFLNILDSKYDKTASRGGEEGVSALFHNLAKTMKNIFYAIAGIYLIVLVLILFFSSNTEEEVGKFKKGIIWISAGIILMQLSSSFVSVLFDRDIDKTLATNFSDVIIYPMIELLRFMAAFVFVTIAIYSFFVLVTANGDEEKVKRGKLSIFQAIIGFFMLKITEILVINTYGKVICSGKIRSSIGGLSGANGTGNLCISKPEFNSNGELIIKIINWVNSFVGIITVLFIIWAGIIILFSNGDEEKVKKAKGIIIYVIIGIFILVLSYLILNFLPWAQNKGLI